MRLPHFWIALSASLCIATCAFAQRGGSMTFIDVFESYSVPTPNLSEPYDCRLNLLKNPGLEAGMEAWYGGGSLTVLSFEENQALQSCNTYEPAFQTIKALPNEPYTLRVFAKKDKDASGTVSIKILNDEFVPIHQQFIDIESESYSLHKTTIVGSAKTSFIEINIFQDGGEGCVFADNWCLSLGKKGEKYCENSKLEIKEEPSIQEEKEVLPQKEATNEMFLSTMQALAQNPNVIAYWDMKTASNQTKNSKIFTILRNYIFEEAQ